MAVTHGTPSSASTTATSAEVTDRPIPADTSRPPRPVRRRAGCWAISLGAFLYYSADSLLQQAQFKTTVDITIFQQAISNYAHGRAPDVLIKSQAPFNILGDHFSPIMAVLAPFYRWWPSVNVLLIAQALFLAIGVHVVTRLGVRRLGGLGYYLGGSFALSWGIVKVIDFDFHEACFAVAFLALALEALVDRRWGWMLAWCALLLTVKEDTPLFILGIALVFAVWRQWRWAAGMALFAVVSFTVLTLVVIPHFSYTGAYTYFSSTGAGGGSQFSPIALVQTFLGNLASFNGIRLLVVLAATATIGIRSPVILVMLPTLLLRFVSHRDSYLLTKYYYNSTLVVVCLVALILAVEQRRVRTGATAESIRQWWRSTRGKLAMTGLAVVVLVNIKVTAVPQTVADAFRTCQRCVDGRRLIDEIPAGARVISDVGLLGSIADRNPVLMAVPTWTDSTGIPLRADWIILNLDADAGPTTPSWAPARRKELLGEGYLQVDQAGSLVLLTKPGAPGP